MKSVAIPAALLTLTGCQSDEQTILDRCFPGLAEKRVQGLVVRVSAPIHGGVTSLLSENCKLKALALEFNEADQPRINALEAEQNPGAWLLEGRVVSIDYQNFTVTLAPGVQIARAPALTGEQLIARFKEGRSLR